MIDLKHLAEFSFLSNIAKKNVKQFIDAHVEVKKMQDVYNLLKVHYLIEINDECWSGDIVATMNNKRNWMKTIKIANNAMANKRLLRIVARDPIRGDKYEITNKGRFIIDQYMSWIREEERKVFYEIKLSRKKSKEHKENK
jgi:hypothetical protein